MRCKLEQHVFHEWFIWRPNAMSICVAPSASLLIQRAPQGYFTIGPLNGVPQVECADFEEALYAAGRFGAPEDSNLWYESTAGDPHRLADVFALRRLWNDYIELPTLRLSREQVQRLLDVDQRTCGTVLAVLTEVGLLQQSGDGTYERATDRHACIPPLRIKPVAPRRTRAMPPQ